MRFIGKNLIFSPSDLCTYAESEFASWMDRCSKEQKDAYEKDEADEMQEVLGRRGILHEIAVKERFKKDGVVVTDLSEKKYADTLEAMRRGDAVIYQATLECGRFSGVADFLVRVEGKSSLGSYHYEIWDSKLAKKTKANYLLQLCSYAEMLEAIQGRRPECVCVALGSGTNDRHRTNDYYFYYENLRDRFLAFQDAFDISKLPNPEDSRSYGKWSEEAEKILLEKDSLLQVARITRVQKKRLEAAGICTMEQLGKADPETNVKGIAMEVFQRLVHQARLQSQSKGKAIPDFELLPAEKSFLTQLPAFDDADVYFDMEGFPLDQDGLEYLWGFVHKSKNKMKFDCFWAHSPDEEKLALQNFVEFVHSRWLANPNMHVYHYAAYETRAVAVLAQRHSVCEDKVDDLLRNGVFVDLYQIVRNSVVIGGDNYSLKTVEKLYRRARSTDVANAAASVVYYQKWLDACEDRVVADKILKDIRDYNEDDCQSTLELADWLREQAKVGRIVSSPAKEKKDPQPEPEERKGLVAELSKLGETGVLLGQLMDYHNREYKVDCWEFFSKTEHSADELYDDRDCIGGLVADGQAPEKLKQSLVFGFRFDPAQEVKAEVGDYMRLFHDTKSSLCIRELDVKSGIVKLSSKSIKVLPEMIDLLPSGPRKNEFRQLIEEYANAFVEGKKHAALDDFLNRRPPRLKASVKLPKNEESTSVDAIVNVIRGLDGSSLVIQGPPGAGKTYVAAQAIAALCKAKKRVGIMSHSHKAIDNLLGAAASHLKGLGRRIIKWGQDSCDHEEVAFVEGTRQLGDISTVALMGGTAWAFAKDIFDDQFDYLFIDEASQVCVANLVAVSRSARNFVLLGDQMQLAQPARASHPGESGHSCLDFYLKGQATIPLHQGIFLPMTRRLHPEICGFISDAIYEGRLTNHESTVPRQLIPTGKEKWIKESKGIHFIPVAHEGNRDCSEEEAIRIQALIEELLKMNFQDGHRRRMTPEDILIVAPYNAHVRMLRTYLGEDWRIGTVDKFQGQEAPVAILALGASSAADAPRGVDFLFDKNRLNVALSRAKSLSLVVGSPDLALHHAANPQQMTLVNLFCRLLVGEKDQKAKKSQVV